MQTALERGLHYINGQFTPSSGTAMIEAHDPATEEMLDTVPRGTAQDAAAALSAAHAAFPTWRRTSANARAHLLHDAAAHMRQHQEQIVRLLTLEEGKPIPESDEEVEWLTTTFDYYAELGRHERGRVLPSGEYTQLNLVLKEPYGVVLCIIPWNYPLLLLAWKVAPALAAGNTVIIKPSELPPLSTLYLAEHCLAHFPPGVINVLIGFGPEVAEPLVTPPDVPVIAFTGSLATGQRIASLAAPLMKKLHLELGGKDPFVIADDADPELAARALAYAALTNAGQVCTSTERVYIPKVKAMQLTEALVAHVQGIGSKLRQVKYCLAILAVMDGQSFAQGALILRVHEKTIAAWVCAFCCYGLQGAPPKKPTGRPPKLTPTQKEALATLIEEGPGGEDRKFKRGLQPGSTRGRTVWTGSAAGGADSKGILHALQRGFYSTLDNQDSCSARNSLRPLAAPEA